MGFEKTPLEKAAGALADKADECLTLANAQHETADKQQANVDAQHANADKLEVIGHVLEAQAVAIEGEKQIIASRTSPPLQETPKANADTLRVRNR